jgi:hypothetical protein
MPLFNRKHSNITPRNKRSIKLFLLLGIPSFLGLIATIFLFSPDTNLSFGNYKIPILPLFFLLLFNFFFSLGSFLFKSKTHGLLLGLFVISYFLFYLNNLTHPFFFILLAGLFLTLELLFTYRK